MVAAPDKASINDAMSRIKNIVAVPEIGEVYTSKVKSIMPYGCFVEFLSGKEGLLHISEIDWKRFATMEETGINEGDTIDVKLVDVDQKTGKFKLSHRALIEKPEGYVERPERPQRAERPQRPQRNNDRQHGNNEGRTARQEFRHSDYENKGNQQANNTNTGDVRSALDDFLK